MRRMSAEERREEVLRAATIEFAGGGFEGTSTATIARRVGVSQPYLFRLFPSKHALFLAAVRHAFEVVEQAMREAAEGLQGPAAISAMGDCYRELLTDTPLLQFQLQLYAASLHDPACRDLARRGMSNLWQMLAGATREDPEAITQFLARGMLLNVLTALGVPYQPKERLPASLARWAAKSSGRRPKSKSKPARAERGSATSRRS